MCLVIEIQAIGDELFEFDLRRHFEWSSAAGTALAPLATGSTVVAATLATAITRATVSFLISLIGPTIIWPGRAVLALRLPLRARTLRPALRFRSRGLGSFGSDCFDGGRRSAWLDGRGWRFRRDFHLRRYFMLHIIRHTIHPLRFRRQSGPF
jgi:hypothetical protein